MNFNLNSKNLQEIPFQYKLDVSTAPLLDGLAASSDTVIPRALEILHKEVTLVRNSAGLVCPDLTLKQLLVQHTEAEAKWLLGLMQYLNADVRSSILGKMVQSKNVQYSTLVPLVMSAFKRFRKVEYSEWDFSHPKIKYFIDKGLLEAVKCDIPSSDFNKDNLIEIRNWSMEIGSGAKAGKMRKATDYFKIKSSKITGFDSLPTLVKIMFCQIWVAHPSLRNNLMILDNINIDLMPAPLIIEEFTTPTRVENNNNATVINDLMKEMGWM